MEDSVLLIKGVDYAREMKRINRLGIGGGELYIPDFPRKKDRDAVRDEALVTMLRKDRNFTVRVRKQHAGG